MKLKGLERLVYPETQVKPRFYTDEQKDLPYNLLDDHMPAMAEEREIDPMTSVMSSMERSPSSIDPRSAGLIADAVAAGLPALSAALSGASPSIQNRQFGRMDQYAKTRGDALVPSKNNLATLENDQGEPYYELFDNSLGMKPYIPKRGIGGGAGAGRDRQFQPITLKNIKTGEIAGAKQTAQGYFSQDDEQYDMREWLPFKKEELIKEKTVQGGSKVKARDVYDGKLKPVSSQSGLGDFYGGVPKEQAQAGIKAGEKAKASSQKALEAAVGAERAADILRRPNLSPELAAQGIFAIIKANNGERLSDSDYAQARGTEFKSYLRTAEEWANGRIAGNIPPRVLQAYAEAATLMSQSKRAEVEAIKESYVPKGMLPKQGQREVEEQAGISNKVEKKPDWKSKYKGFK